MTTNKLEQAARQALDALEVHQPDPEQQMVTEAIIALREALELTKSYNAVNFGIEQEPVAWGRVFDGDIIDCICPEEHALNEGDYTIPLYAAPVTTICRKNGAYCAEQAEQEPVAWVNKERTRSIEWLKIAPEHGTKLYSHPVRTKDLTDDEIMKINVDTAGIVPTCDRQFHFARAVIAADRKKNK